MRENMYDEDEMNVPGTVWHYTDGVGLKSILENRVLWASSAAYMNDFKELITGNDVLNKIYGELREQSSESHRELGRLVDNFTPPREDNFILSASEDPNSLTMWRYYGRDQVGFAVGLDGQAPLGIRAQTSATRHPHPPANYYGGPRGEFGTLEEYPDEDGQVVEDWQPMIYEEERQEEIIRRALESLRMALDQARGNNFSFGVALRKLKLLSELNRIKHKGFKDEHEVRILAQLSPPWKYVLHRSGRFGMIPYVELGMPSGGSHGSRREFEGGRQKMEPLPIRQINIGPTPYREEAKYGLEQLLSFLGYHDVKVIVSAIPYR